jgi:DNA-binding GntR family transcriptional regulator
VSTPRTKPARKKTTERGASSRTDQAPARHLVVEELRKLCLEAGTAGLVLPGEPKLASQLGIGRATLRDALTRLEAEGLILRRQGADTIVNPAAFDLAARIDLQVDFAEILRDCGFEASMVLLEEEHTTLTEAAANALGLDVSVPALRTLKRWNADGRPVMVAMDWVPLLDPNVVPAASHPVFEIAAAISGEETAWEVASPGALAVDAEIAAILQVDVGSAVWTLERVGIGRSGRRSFFAFEYHVPSIVQYGFIRSLQRP